MKKTFIFIIALIFSGIFYSCEKFLDQQPIGSFSEDILANSEGVEMLLIGAYTAIKGSNSLRDPANMPLFGTIHGTECFKGANVGGGSFLEFAKFEVTTGNSNLRRFWTFYYDAVYRCNLTLKILKEVSDMTAERKTRRERHS